MPKRKNEAGKDKQPVDDLLRRTAGKRDHKRIVDTFHVANPRLNQRTVSIREKKEVINDSEDQARKHAAIDDVAQCETPVLKTDKQRPLKLALACDGKSETPEHEHHDEA